MLLTVVHSRWVATLALASRLRADTSRHETLDKDMRRPETTWGSTPGEQCHVEHGSKRTHSNCRETTGGRTNMDTTMNHRPTLEFRLVDGQDDTGSCRWRWKRRLDERTFAGSTSTATAPSKTRLDASCRRHRVLQATGRLHLGAFPDASLSSTRWLSRQ